VCLVRLCNHQDRFSPKSSNAKVSNPAVAFKKAMEEKKRCGERRRRGLGPVQAVLAVGQTAEVAYGHRLPTDRRDLNKKMSGISEKCGSIKIKLREEWCEPRFATNDKKNYV